MPRFVVVLPLEPLDAGSAFTLREWPLHLTVAPTFDAVSLDQVIAVLAPLSVDQPAISVRAGRSEGFGRAMSRPASVIEESESLLGLHEALCTSLTRIGAEFDHPDFTGPGYRPHVTKTRTASVQDGEAFELRQIAVVDMAPHGDLRMRRVVWAATLY